MSKDLMKPETMVKVEISGDTLPAPEGFSVAGFCYNREQWRAAIKQARYYRNRGQLVAVKRGLNDV